LAGTSHHLRGILLAAAGAVCWSPDGLILRTVQADAWQALFWRMLSYAVVLALLLAARERAGLVATCRSVGRPGILAGLLFAAVNTCFVFSITHTAVANTLVIFAMVPLFGAVLGWMFLRERVPPRTLLVMAIGIGSIGAIFSEKLAQGSALGDIFAVLATLLFAGNLTLVRKYPDVSLLPSMALGGLIGVAIGAIPSDPLAVPPADIALLVASGAVQQPAAFFLFLSGARYLPPAEVGLLNLVETVLGPLWVWLAIGERPSTVAFAAGSVVIAALVGHSWLALRQARRGAAATPRH
jgi:drug/metabolite transporter (DMT)-like permease